jgi:poly(A) polymerase
MMTAFVITELMQVSNVKAVMHALNSEESEARFVGGAVRDALMGKPIQDIDIATPLHPEKVMELLTTHHIKVIPTGLKHGTVTAVVGNQQFEITTLRRDVACDGRHAEVAFTDDWQADAARRDFTMNAISCSMDGTIHDYFSGLQDIKDGIIRFVGLPHQRITEDALRILRFFRFAATYNLQLDGVALSACALHADLLGNLSGERIQWEMFKLLAAPDPTTILTTMQEHRIIGFLLPCEVTLTILPRLLTLEKELCIPITALRRLAALLRTCPDITLAQLEAMAEQWKLSLRQRTNLRQLVLPGIAITPKLTMAKQKKAIRTIGKQLFAELVILSWAEANMQAEKLQQLRENFCTMLLLADTWEPPVFPLTGNDLLSHGIKEGKPLGTWLKKAESWWEESDYRLTKEQILDRIKGVKSPEIAGVKTTS